MTYFVISMLQIPTCDSDAMIGQTALKLGTRFRAEARNSLRRGVNLPCHRLVTTGRPDSTDVSNRFISREFGGLVYVIRLVVQNTLTLPEPFGKVKNWSL